MKNFLFFYTKECVNRTSDIVCELWGNSDMCENPDIVNFATFCPKYSGLCGKSTKNISMKSIAIYSPEIIILITLNSKFYVPE